MACDIERLLWYDNASLKDISAYRTGAWLADRPCTVKGVKDCIWPPKAMFALLDELAKIPRLIVRVPILMLRHLVMVPGMSFRLKNFANKFLF